MNDPPRRVMALLVFDRQITIFPVLCPTQSRLYGSGPTYLARFTRKCVNLQYVCSTFGALQFDFNNSDQAGRQPLLHIVHCLDNRSCVLDHGIVANRSRVSVTDKSVCQNKLPQSSVSGHHRCTVCPLNLVSLCFMSITMTYLWSFTQSLSVPAHWLK